MIIEPLIIVIFCTVIQNIFGVGILVFGTPILLSLDYDLMTTLGILLPSSLLVSLIQILETRGATSRLCINRITPTRDESLLCQKEVNLFLAERRWVTSWPRTDTSLIGQEDIHLFLAKRRYLSPLGQDEVNLPLAQQNLGGTSLAKRRSIAPWPFSIYTKPWRGSPCIRDPRRLGGVSS